MHAKSCIMEDYYCGSARRHLPKCDPTVTLLRLNSADVLGLPTKTAAASAATQNSCEPASFCSQYRCESPFSIVTRVGSSDFPTCRWCTPAKKQCLPRGNTVQCRTSIACSGSIKSVIGTSKSAVITKQNDKGRADPPSSRTA